MKIIVDKIPPYPVDCLFSVLNTNSTGTYFICSLRENIDGKHKNSPCICKDTKNCECLREECK
jgi:hypothetical protein